MDPVSDNKNPPTVQDQEAQRKRLQGQVDDTKEVLLDTIDQLIERGSNLESIADKTGETEEQSLEFTSNAHKMRVKAQFKSWAMTASIVGMVIGGFYGLSMGASLPMMLASSGIVGALFYGGMWMCSGIIQSFIGLPIFRFSFQSNIQQDERMFINTEQMNIVPDATPMLHAFQLNPVINEENMTLQPNFSEEKKTALR